MKISKVLGIALIAFLGGVSALSLNWIFKDKNSYQNQEISANYQSSNNRLTSYNSNAGEQTDFTFAAEKTTNAVVHVKTTLSTGGQNQTITDFFFGNPYGGGMQGQAQASGSGVIISTDGYIVTNNHVVENATKIEVVLNDKRSYEAKLVGRDPSTDIALLKIDEKELPMITFGNSDDLKVGEWVLAVGNPFNLTSTVTAGIVSAKARNLNLLDKNYAIESFIQTDAAVNPGNSGGALVNTKGELIGINTAIASQTGSYSGYSFAVPSSIVKKVVADLTEFGTVQRAMLGVSIQDIDSDLAKKIGIDELTGVYVADVNESSAAKDAGIQKDDIILKVNNILVNKVAELQEQISKFRPGEKVVITVKRNKNLKDFTVLLKNSLGTTGFVNKEASDVLGATFEKPTESEMKKLGITHGVKISELGAGKLMKAGVQQGFIITSINRMEVNSFEEIQNVLNRSRGGIYIEGIYPDGTSGYYAFGIR